MKILLLITTIFYSLCGHAHVGKAERFYKKSKSPLKNAKISQELSKSKYYFSAVIYAKKHLAHTNQISSPFENLLEDLILKTGTMSFTGLHDEVLKKHTSVSLSFILGIKHFNQKRYQSSQKYMNQIPTHHRFAPEARFIRGSALNLLNKFEEARDQYKRCESSAHHFRDQAKDKKLKRYFAIIRESCVIHRARILYKQAHYKKALLAYESIPKTSYRWPYLLLEKAWTNYHLGDYNRTLGLLVTYKSPLLKSYFFPEAEVLSALSYFKLCLWEDGLSLIEKYYKIYRPRSEALKSVLVPHKNSHTYFIKMLLNPINDDQKSNPFIRNLATQTKKKIKFSLDLANFKKAENELNYLKKRKQTPFIGALVKSLQGGVNWRTKHLNHYIKREMFNFINDIHRFSFEMFNIKLEVLALKRDLVYTNKKLISKRGRGSLQNVKRASKQHFYRFKGAFWADELGEYSFGLKSNCERVKQKEEINK